MKRIKYLYIIAILGIIGIFSSCEEAEPVLFPDDVTMTVFRGAKGEVTEGKTIKIPIYVASREVKDVSFDVTFNGEDYSNPAVEGTDFELESSKTVTLNGVHEDTIVVKTLDNDVRDYDKMVKVTFTNLKNTEAGLQDTTYHEFELIIRDNEHPLKLILGEYEVAAQSGFSGGGDVNLTMNVMPVDGDVTQVMMRAGELAGGYNFSDDDVFYGQVDIDAKTIQIEAGQSFSDAGYGASKLTGFVGASGSPQIADGDFIQGTFDDQGTITINDWMGIVITEGAYVGAMYQLIQANSVWTKAAASATAKKSGEQDPQNRIPRRLNR